MAFHLKSKSGTILNMLLKTLKAILLLKAQSLEVYVPQKKDPYIIEFPPTMVSNFEIVNFAKLEKQLFAFLSKHKLEKQSAFLLITKCDKSTGELYESTHELINAICYAFSKFGWDIKAAAAINYFEDIRLDTTLSPNDRQTILKESLANKDNLLYKQGKEHKIEKSSSPENINKLLFGPNYFFLSMVVGVMIIVGAGVFYQLSRPQQAGVQQALLPSSQPTQIPLAQATPATEVLGTNTVSESEDKSSLSVSILNASGKSGQAGILKSQFTKNGFKQITVGNHKLQTGTTVSFSPEVPDVVKKEVLGILENNFTKVETIDYETDNPDIYILIGR